MLKPVSLAAAVLFGLLLVVIRLNAMWDSCLDFPQFYFASQLLLFGKASALHDTSVYPPLMEAAGIPPGTLSVYFNRPAIFATLFWPLSFLSFRSAQAVFIGANMLLWGLLIWKVPLWLKAPGHLRVWLFSFFPFVNSVGLCQDTLAVTLIVAYVFFPAMKRNERLAGALLSLALIKPHLIVLLPVVLLLENRLRALQSFLLSGLLMAFASFTMVGVEGVKQWFLLLRAPTTDMLPELMGNLRAIAIHCGWTLAAAAAIVTIVAGLFVLRHGQYCDKLSVCILSTLLLGPHIYAQDYSLAAIVARITPHPLVRYGILLPWYYFWRERSFLPVIWLSVACMVVIALSYLHRCNMSLLPRRMPAT